MRLKLMMKSKQAFCAAAFFFAAAVGASAECVTAPGGVGAMCTEGGSAPSETGAWSITTEKSPMDDSKSVFATLESETMISGRFGGGSAPAQMIFRCMEGTTAAMFIMNGQFLADSSGYGKVEYRVDDKKATHVNAEESTDNEALGLWSGKRAIPFIKGLYGADRLIVRITPFNESAITMEFKVTGTEKATEGIREACGW